MSSEPLQLQLGVLIPDCLGIGDTHYLELVVPDTAPTAGGYFQVIVSDITADVQGQLNVILADSSGTPLNGANYSFDEQSSLFLGVAASTSFLVEVSSNSTLPLGYTVQASFVGIGDPYKPDGQMSSNAPMITPHGFRRADPTCGLASGAQPRSSPASTAGFDDWFQVQVSTAGTATVTLTNFPTDFAPAVDFVDVSGNIILPNSGASHSNIFGALLTQTVIAPTAGTYYLHVYPY